MYGLVNQAVEDLIRSRHGEAAWEAIKQRAGVHVPAFVSMDAYPDSVTFSLVQAASDHLHVPVDQLLEAFGEYWTVYTAQRGYGDLFALGGRTLVEFIQNLDHLHAHVALSFPQLRPPIFWCTQVTDGSLRLHYRSTRDGLGPMVIGLVRGLGRVFETPVTVAHVVRRADGADHDEFDVAFTPQS